MDLSAGLVSVRYVESNQRGFEVSPAVITQQSDPVFGGQSERRTHITLNCSLSLSLVD